MSVQFDLFGNPIEPDVQRDSPPATPPPPPPVEIRGHDRAPRPYTFYKEGNLTTIWFNDSRRWFNDAKRGPDEPDEEDDYEPETMKTGTK